MVSGPSGSGKGTLLARVLPELNNIEATVSATTRQPRVGEIDGRDYHFLTDAAFDEITAQDGLLEWASVHGRRYGTLRSEVLRIHESGSDALLEIDPQGARQVKQSFPAAEMIFIMPPSLEVLRQRLINRATESDEEINKRVAAAESEIQAAAEYDIVILNDDLDTAVNQLLAKMKEMTD